MNAQTENPFALVVQFQRPSFRGMKFLKQGHDLSFVCGTNKETQKAGETKKFEDVQASRQRPTGDRGETIPGVWLGKR